MKSPSVILLNWKTRKPAHAPVAGVVLVVTRFGDEEEVGTELVIGPNAAKPLHLDIPLFVSDMGFGALSEEAKVALTLGADGVALA